MRPIRPLLAILLPLAMAAGVARAESVMLTGTVRSWAEKNQAVEAAWASPHVTEVDNRIVVRPY